MNSFLVNLVGSFVNEIFKENVKDGKDSNAGVFVIMMIMFLGFPIQGFLNCIVYFQPMVSRWRGREESKGLFWAIAKALTEEPGASTDIRLPAERRSFRSLSAFCFPSSTLRLQQKHGDGSNDALDQTNNTTEPASIEETYRSEMKASSSSLDVTITP